MERRRERLFSSRRVIALCATLAWLGVMSASAAFLSGSEANARHASTQRLQARIGAAAEFASVYVHEIFTHERTQATTWLTAPRPTAGDLRLAAAALGARVATLLDAQGEVIRAQPNVPGLAGTDVSLEYAYLTDAMRHGSGVSDVVPSSVGGAPVVAFAVPFSTPTGRRVFSLGFAVSRTPLGAFTSHLLTLPGNRVYLVDDRGTLITGGAPTGIGTSLAQRDPAMALALRRETSGSYPSSRGTQVLASAPVAGTPWRIVASEPAVGLYSTIDGNSGSLAWAVLAGLTLAGLVIIAICVRLAWSRNRLVDLAAQLHRLARIDPLTELSNRRDLDETLHAALAATTRAQRPLSVLLIDVDHFKQVNDTLGHDAGDAVLVDIAQAMSTSLRAGDSLGRWGGEEFLAVLPEADAQAAEVVAERLRCEVRDTVSAGGLAITVTVGVAARDSDTKDELITRADAALYEGKAAGRDTVHLAAPGRSVTREPDGAAQLV